MRTRGSARSSTSERSSGIVLVLPAGISHRGQRGLPSAMAVGHLEHRRRRPLEPLPLRERDVDRRVAVEDPAGQVQHDAAGRPGLRAARARGRAARRCPGTASARSRRGRRRPRARSPRCGRGPSRRSPRGTSGRETVKSFFSGNGGGAMLLVRDDRDAGRMVHRAQLGEIEVHGLPELLREVEAQAAVLGRSEQRSRHDQPLARVGGGLVHAVVEKPDGALAENVRHETPARAVERVEERAGALQLLHLAQQRPRRRVEHVLRDPVGPDDPQDVRAAAGRRDPDA